MTLNAFVSMGYLVIDFFKHKKDLHFYCDFFSYYSSQFTSNMGAVKLICKTRDTVQ